MPNSDKREKKSNKPRAVRHRRRIDSKSTRNLSADRPILTHGSSESDEMVI